MSVPRVAIVTGAAGDLGKYISLRLADDGLDIACNDLPEQSVILQDLVYEIKNKGRRAISVPTDVSIEADVKTMVETTVKELGSVDICIGSSPHKHGSVLIKPFPVDEQIWDKIFSVNVKGAPLCSAYCASKFAVRGLTQTAVCLYPLAQQWNMRDSELPQMLMRQDYCNWRHKDVADNALGLPSGGFEAHSLANVIKMGKLGRPEDIAGLVSFLSSKDSGYVTGQTHSCDGGMHIA
ncbi:NAD-binding protein [Fomitiporia mediterranea MF3/22]|uniref:NAD-binding protein n=1 Tax=Fomitiporia mediterranea (strain MF3/22) TaxID=694068 RepID=UPI0004409514|nr:NAD-binding protein [Fomitiporia mediterranea MF3/22]EJC99748.1 NAD-binding protein [Fomitiporia mediterranea MF3/22]